MYDAFVAALDPFDMLVRLGKITQANLQAADLVEAGIGTSTRAARLVAIGVDKEKLLKDLSELTRMPIAPPDVLAALSPMKLPSSYSMTMKELLAVPIGRVDEGILDVAIADPRTTTKLRDAAIAHRPHLALEADILRALARVFPDSEALDPLTEPTLKNVPLAPRPISVEEGAVQPDVPGASIVSDLLRDLQAPIATAPANGDIAPIAPIAPDLDEQPVSSPSLSPFVLTKQQTEVTERVRPRDRADRSATLAPAPSPVQRARALVDDARMRVAQMSARTLSIIALGAVIFAVVVLASIVLSASGDDGVADAGVELVVDAGEAPVVVPAPPPVIEQPKEKPKPKRKTPRNQRKKQRR